eukprot:TRINITY_DN103701_c0_g1_i1.p1 TRINITY_DN103701_c0_g1~~TRINITY_DN103701_c0_g1_i1.p1  ORF type:complete len:951 (+),score=97.02 TRINITY_DN103701_c0_g1_i1:109-2853(+)
MGGPPQGGPPQGGPPQQGQYGQPPQQQASMPPPMGNPAGGAPPMGGGPMGGQANMGGPNMGGPNMGAPQPQGYSQVQPSGPGQAQQISGMGGGQPPSPQWSGQQGSAGQYQQGQNYGYQGNTQPQPPQAPPVEPLKFKALSLRRPALGPHAGQLPNQEEFPRLSLDMYTEGEAKVNHPPSAVPINPCSSKFIRCSFGSVPNSGVLLNNFPMPFGATINPMAKPDPDKPIPLVNFSAMGQNVGVVRCRRCRTYINPYVRFIDGGRKWNCNVCSSANDVPPEYHCPVDGNGIRRDIQNRPELLNATCEFVAPPEYMVRPPQRPSYIFCLDVSHAAVSSGLLAAACNALLSCISSLPGEDRTQVAIITFDSNVHVYNLKSTLSQAKMMVCPELTQKIIKGENLEDVTLPLPDDLFANLKDSLPIITDLLQRLPRMFQKTQNVEVAFGPALCAAMKMMLNMGGKLVMFLSAIPSIGAGRLANRDDRRLYGTTKEKDLFVSANDWYRDRSLQASKEQICVDLFLMSSTYIDVATIGQLAKYTGGQLTYQKGFYPDKGDSTKLEKDVARLLQRDTGFEAVMRVRCNAGVKVTHFFGHFFVRGQDLLALPNTDEDKGFAIMIQHLPNQMLSQSTFSIQAALLYTTTSGERRIRVHTLSLPVTASPVELYRNVDLICGVELISKMAVDTTLSQSLEAARSSLFDTAVAILKHYRNILAHQHRADQSQLVLPDALKELPLLIMCVIKYITFRADNEAQPDDRVAGMARMMTTPLARSLRFLHPRLFDLLKVLRKEEDVLVTPTASTALDSTGIYMLDNGLQLAVWVGRRVAPEVLKVMFNTDDPAQISSLSAESSEVQNVAQFISRIQEESINCGWPVVVLVKEGSPLERTTFSKWLVEDEAHNAHNYGNFLAQIHRRISQGQ